MTHNTDITYIKIHSATLCSLTALSIKLL